jgi:hypothetical protein
MKPSVDLFERLNSLTTLLIHKAEAKKRDAAPKSKPKKKTKSGIRPPEQSSKQPHPSLTIDSSARISTSSQVIPTSQPKKHHLLPLPRRSLKKFTKSSQIDHSKSHPTTPSPKRSSTGQSTSWRGQLASSIRLSSPPSRGRSRTPSPSPTQKSSSSKRSPKIKRSPKPKRSPEIKRSPLSDSPTIVTEFTFPSPIIEIHSSSPAIDLPLSEFQFPVDSPPPPVIEEKVLDVVPVWSFEEEEEEWTEDSTSSVDDAILLRSSTSDDIAPIG